MKSRFTEHRLFAPMVLLLVTVIVAVLSFTGLTSSWLIALTAPLFDGALMYAEEAGHQASLALLTLSGLHAGLSTVESGQVGISLILELDVSVGRLVSSLVDLSGKAYHVALADRVIWTIIHFMLQVLQRAQGWLLTLLICLLLLEAWLRVHIATPGHWHRMAARLSRIFMILTVSLCFLFPLALLAAKGVSTHLTAEHVQQLRQNYTQFDEHLNVQAKESGLKDRAEHAVKQLEKAVVKLEHKVHALSSHLAQHIALLLFNSLLVPFGIWFGFIALWRLATRATRTPASANTTRYEYT